MENNYYNYFLKECENMIYEKEYDYKIISEFEFNEKYLLSKNDGSKYSEYIMVCYDDNGKITIEKIYNKDSLKMFNNIISFYGVQEIISSCDNFDSEFIYKKYYKINDIYFIKYKLNDSFKMNNDNDKIQKIFEELLGEKNDSN